MRRNIYAAIADILNEPTEIREEVASDPNTDIETLAILSEDPDYGIRAMVAANSSTPRELLIKLSRDDAFPVRQAARVEYELELSFAGMIGASETIEILARPGATEEELQGILHAEYEYDLYDFLDVTDVDQVDDDEWEVTVNFNGYLGCDEVYSVVADDADEAESWAYSEAAFDFSISDFTELPRT
jgi:hypothetical protein